LVESLAETVGDAIRTDRLVAPVARLAAGHALFLDVGDLAVGAHFAVPTGHTPTGQGREAEESDETHKSRLRSLQAACRICTNSFEALLGAKYGGYRGPGPRFTPGAVREANQVEDLIWMMSPSRWIARIQSRHHAPICVSRVIRQKTRRTRGFRPISRM